MDQISQYWFKDIKRKWIKSPNIGLKILKECGSNLPKLFPLISSCLILFPIFYLNIQYLQIQFCCLFHITHLWPFSKSKLNLKSDRVNVVPPIECLLYLPNVLALQDKLGLERLTRLGNSNVLRLPVFWYFKNV